jgi:hypothetical protein
MRCRQAILDSRLAGKVYHKQDPEVATHEAGQPVLIYWRVESDEI